MRRLDYTGKPCLPSVLFFSYSLCLSTSPLHLYPRGGCRWMRNKKKDIVLGSLIWVSAAITVAVLVGVIGYILVNGLPNMTWNFLTTTYSAAKSGSKGILPMIINTLYVIVISLLLGTPVGIGSAIYLTQYAKQGRLVLSLIHISEP